jgi:hypothetical protein
VNSVNSTPTPISVGGNFYKNIAETAKKHSVVISVIGMEDSDCSMTQLGYCAEITNGQVNIVKPLVRGMRMGEQKRLMNFFFFTL